LTEGGGKCLKKRKLKIFKALRRDWERKNTVTLPGLAVRNDHVGARAKKGGHQGERRGEKFVATKKESGSHGESSGRRRLSGDAVKP